MPTSRAARAVQTRSGEWTMEPGVRVDGTICDQSMFFDCGWTPEHTAGLGILATVWAAFALARGVRRFWRRIAK